MFSLGLHSPALFSRDFVFDDNDAGKFDRSKKKKIIFHNQIGILKMKFHK